MSKTEQLILMAQDEMVQDTPESAKIEKLRRKVNIAVPYPEQKPIREKLAADISGNFFWNKMLGENRQMLALPFWGIAGLGLLLGISFKQPLDFIAPVIGFPLAIYIQKLGWDLEAKNLVIKVLDDIEAGVEGVRAESANQG